MKHFIYGALFFISINTFTGCKGGTEPLSPENIARENVPDLNEADQKHSPSNKTAPSVTEDIIEILGTVVYKDFEGGFYAIDAEDGSKYDPMNLPEAFRKDGLKVKVTASLKPDAMGFHMYGGIIEIKTIIAQ